MIIGLRAEKFRLALKLNGAELSKQVHLIGKETYSEILPHKAQTRRDIQKYKYDPKSLILNLSCSSLAKSQKPCLVCSPSFKQPQTSTSKSPLRSSKTPLPSPNANALVESQYKERSYRNALKKSIPSIFQLFRTLSAGMSEFYKDMKWYWRIHRAVRQSPDGLRSLNLKELDVYMQVPKDMVKLIPTIIGTWIPIIGYAVCALIFMYPRILTTHFWTPQQRDHFLLNQIQKRDKNSKKVVRNLKRTLNTVKEPFEYCDLASMLAMVGYESAFPTKEDLLNIQELFAKPPYNFQSLNHGHIKLLSAMHGLPYHFSRRVKLKEHAHMIHHMDYAIEREGGVDSISPQMLKRACALRGLNPVDLNKESMILWLKKWIEITKSIEEKHMSLLLHLPLFLAFNHPNNFKLHASAEEKLKKKAF